MKYLCILAVIGLTICIIAHGATFLGINPEDVCPGLWLYILTFVVIVPMTVVLSRRKGGMPRKISELMPHAPSWMKITAFVIFAYAMFNFFYTKGILLNNDAPSVMDGRYVLHSHGHVSKTLTPEEYERCKIYEFRFSSGHLMAFFSLSSAVLYSLAKERQNQKK